MKASAEIQEVVERVGGGTAKISTPVGNLSHINLTPHFHTCGTMGSECCAQSHMLFLRSERWVPRLEEQRHS